MHWKNSQPKSHGSVRNQFLRGRQDGQRGAAAHATTAAWTHHQRQLAHWSDGDPVPGDLLRQQVCLEGYTEALRQEVKPFGIHVSLTEAGFLRTPMMNHRHVAARRMTEYDAWRQRALNAIRSSEDKAPGPDVVADMLLEIISSSAPRLRYLIGQHAKSITRLRRFLPAGLFEQGVRRTFSLDKTR